MRHLLASAALAGLVMTAGPAAAQATQPAQDTSIETSSPVAIPATSETLVRVDVTGVADELSGSVGARPDRLPRSVEVPIEIAANVCEVSVAQLKAARNASQHIECNAVKVSQGLAKAAKKQLMP